MFDKILHTAMALLAVSVLVLGLQTKPLTPSIVREALNLDYMARAENYAKANRSPAVLGERWYASITSCNYNNRGIRVYTVPLFVTSLVIA